MFKQLEAEQSSAGRALEIGSRRAAYFEDCQ